MFKKKRIILIKIIYTYNRILYQQTENAFPASAIN